jgi:large subunit ribosomal protein L29
MKARMEGYRKRESSDLVSELEEKRREVFNLRFQQASERATDPQLLRKLRRGVARIKTVLRERELRGEG